MKINGFGGEKMKRWFIKWSRTRPGSPKEEYTTTFDIREHAEEFRTYVEAQDELKLIEFTEKA